jgi:hypothetical protein
MTGAIVLQYVSLAAHFSQRQVEDAGEAVLRPAGGRKQLAPVDN